MIRRRWELVARSRLHGGRVDRHLAPRLYWTLRSARRAADRMNSWGSLIVDYSAERRVDDVSRETPGVGR